MFRWRIRRFMLPLVAALLAAGSLASATVGATASVGHAARHHHGSLYR
ncbi:MAG: hypothetical protein QOH11_3134 [Solirubrobacteraceae bacterium]|jgi:uncharacterized membrane protein YtjA (UPF0391 family)|nr:hypothetical protein [Solirubrobacteraceae bacterium]